MVKDVFWICTCRGISVLNSSGVSSEILAGPQNNRPGPKADGLKQCNTFPEILPIFTCPINFIELLNLNHILLEYSVDFTCSSVASLT